MKIIKRNQLLVFGIAVSCILAITHFAFGYPKSGWGIAAPTIGAAIIEIIAYCYCLKHKE